MGIAPGLERGLYVCCFQTTGRLLRVLASGFKVLGLCKAVNTVQREPGPDHTNKSPKS